MNDTLINATGKSLIFVNHIATQIVVAIIIFLVGLIIARILSKTAYKILKNFSLDGTVKKKTPLGFITLYTSFKTISGSGQCSKTSVPKAQSKLLFSNGIFLPSQLKSGLTSLSYSNALSISNPIYSVTSLFSKIYF